ncbi:MAG: hypothetical protein GTN80_09035 [Nitrososphaeria archaeon]|nr:hypothetical protein [Nitrososphaeria archaeon]NIN53310.1 hypothetical protein [Nitrososphaeria archaeon]NIQ33763.1 hypothetical protein [Nitrososphaeria archaeon]
MKASSSKTSKLYCDSAKVVAGEVISGTHSDVHKSNDVRYEVGLTTRYGNESDVELLYDTGLDRSFLTDLFVHVEGFYNCRWGTYRGSLKIWNYIRSEWYELFSLVPSDTDRIDEWRHSEDPSAPSLTNLMSETGSIRLFFETSTGYRTIIRLDEVYVETTYVVMPRYNTGVQAKGRIIKRIGFVAQGIGSVSKRHSVQINVSGIVHRKYFSPVQVRGEVFTRFFTQTQVKSLVRRTYSTEIQTTGSICKKYFTEVQARSTVVEPFSTDTQVKGTIVKKYSTFPVQVVGEASKPYSTQIETKGTVASSYSAQVRVGGFVRRIYSSETQVTGRISKPYSTQIETKGTVASSYSAQISAVGAIVKGYYKGFQVIGFVMSPLWTVEEPEE